MSKIKDKIKNCTKRTMYIFGDIYTIFFNGKGLIRRITIVRDGVYATTMKIVCIPFTEKAVCRSIWMISTLYPSKTYIVKNQFRLCTLDDIENWINRHFQEG